MIRRIFPAILMAAICVGQVLADGNKPYITRIYDFVPAPGQFVNEVPEWSEGVDRDSIIRQVSEYLCGYEKNGKPALPGVPVSLGAFGGYVVFGFDHPVVNVKDEYDLQIFGNSFQGDSTPTSSGSSEPGIVYVSRDDNHNGIPDDVWYELAGSEYFHPKTQHNYAVTYYRQGPDHTPVPKPPFITDLEAIPWTSNDINPDSTAGYLAENSFHRHSYWPGWIDADTLAFAGTKLRCNAVDRSGKGTDIMQYFFDWGYVDNRPDYDYGIGYNNKPLSSGMNLGFKIDWAVDEAGQPVVLDKIDFVKVQNAMLQDCGWLGETSTEVGGAIDLHPDAVPDYDPEDVNRNGSVDISDLNIVANFILGIQTETEGISTDVNADGNTDISDLNRIIDRILGVR